MCSKISEIDKWFFLRNENSICAMVILFTQWKFFLRNGSFTVPESKNSFCAMTKLQILTTFILRNESRSYAYDVSILCLSCITSYYVPTKVHIKKLLLILYVHMYIVQILFAQWALKYLKIRFGYFKKQLHLITNYSTISYQIIIYFCMNLSCPLCFFEFRVNSFCAMSGVSVEKSYISDLFLPPVCFVVT